jgi:hypothetical protein
MDEVFGWYSKQVLPDNKIVAELIYSANVADNLHSRKKLALGRGMFTFNGDRH